MTALHVATLNIRNLADRWAERLPLLLCPSDHVGLSARLQLGAAR